MKTLRTELLEIAFEEDRPENDPLDTSAPRGPDAPCCWNAIAPRLHAKGWRTIAPYLRGSGPTKFREKQ
jgi:hypothetical protein